MFILFSGGTLGSLFVVSLGYYSRSTVNQVYLRSILYCAPLCDLSCTRSVQFGGIVPSLMNRTVEIHNQTPHEIEVRHDQLLGLEPELLILNEMLSVQDISLHVNRVPTWVVQLYCPLPLNPRHRMERPICGDFKSNVCCCVFKVIHGNNPIIIHLEYI